MSSLGLLIAAVFLTSALSGAIGMGGGVTLLGVMANLLPPPAVVPIHGVIQLTGNTTRTLNLWKKIAWRPVVLYVPSLVLTAFLAVRLYSGSEMAWLRPAIGVFILGFLLWDRFRPRRLALPMWVFAPGGLIGGVLTVLVGATGPYLAAFFLRDDMDREQVIATKAAIQSFGHLIKIPAFLSIGFDYGVHLGLLLPLIAGAIAGTLFGTWVLGRTGERLFRVLFRVILGALAVRLIAMYLIS
jgi:uncharacterized membrane protein YfcA